MSIQLETLNKINTLKTNIESVTGGTYNNLTEAVQALKDGYGASTGEQYQVYEVKYDFWTGYFGASNLGFNIFGLEVATQVEREDGSVDVLPDDAKIKYVEIYFNGAFYRLEDAGNIDGRAVWVNYDTANTTLQTQMIDGKVVASVYYFDATNPNPGDFLYALVMDDLEYDSPIRIYYTTE